MMSPDEKLAAMRAIFDKCITLAAAKGHDYSGTADGLGNFRTFGWKGIIVRLEDKMQRLIQFCKSKMLRVKDESVEDTLMDLIVYASLALIMYREENKPNPANATSDAMKSALDKILLPPIVAEMRLHYPFGFKLLL